MRNSRLIKERNALVNQIRSLLAEQGIVVARRMTRLRQQLPTIVENQDDVLTLLSREGMRETGSAGRSGYLCGLHGAAHLYSEGHLPEAGDPAHADVILDRLVHNAYTIPLKGDSMRSRIAKLTNASLAE